MERRAPARKPPSKGLRRGGGHPDARGAVGGNRFRANVPAELCSEFVDAGRVDGHGRPRPALLPSTSSTTSCHVWSRLKSSSHRHGPVGDRPAHPPGRGPQDRDGRAVLRQTRVRRPRLRRVACRRLPTRVGHHRCSLPPRVPRRHRRRRGWWGRAVLARRRCRSGSGTRRRCRRACPGTPAGPRRGVHHRDRDRPLRHVLGLMHNPHYLAVLDA